MITVVSFLTVIGTFFIRCRICDLKGKEETPMHMISECLPLWRDRWENFGHFDLEREEYISWEPAALVGFVRKFEFENKPN